MLGFAAVTLALALPVIQLGMIDRPSDVGQYPDGDEPVDVAEGASAAIVERFAWETGSVVRSRDFWLVALGVAPFAASGLVMAANAIPFMMHLGVSTEAASGVVVLQSVGAVAGPLLLGSLADRIHPRLLFVGMIATLCVTFGLLSLEPGYAAALGVFFVVGLVGGAMMPVYGALIARLFGPEAFGQVIGLGALVGLPMLFLAPLGFGYAFDASESYSLGLLGLMGVLVAGAGLLLLLSGDTAKRPRRSLTPAA
jgi:MFS family permease